MSDPEKFSAAKVRAILANTDGDRSVSEMLEKAKSLSLRNRVAETSELPLIEIPVANPRRNDEGGPPPTAKWIREGVVEISWRGDSTEWHVAEGLRLLAELAAHRPLRYVIANTVQMTNYNIGVRKPAMGILAFMKSKGCSTLVGIMPGASVRMIASSLSLVVGVKIKVFDSREEALQFVAN